MKKTLIACALGLGCFVGEARADIIRCTFTEPFLNYTYSMAQQRLTITGAGRPTRSLRNVAFQILGPARFIIGRVGSPYVRLNLDFRGSDGMSDFVYPYSAQVPNYDGAGNTLHGGCESNYLRKRTAE